MNIEDDPIWELEKSACNFFAVLFGRYMELDEDVKSSVRDMVEIINSTEADSDTRKAALYNLTDALYPDLVEEIEIQKIKGDVDVPCEECSKTPTHLIKFNQQNRVESHYLCKACEKRLTK
jgi:hypothetical protein